MDGDAKVPDVSGSLMKPWKVVDSIRCDDARPLPEVNLYVEIPEDSDVECPVCGNRCKSINGAEEDIWADMAKGRGIRLVVRSRVAFASCPDCGNHKLQFHWEDPESDFTER